MDAVKFIKEKERMCAFYNTCSGGCYIKKLMDKYELTCRGVIYNHTEEAVSEVEKWSEEHPAKTRKDDFFEKHPKAMITPTGYPEVCAKHIGYCTVCPGNKNCCECWDIPVEE